MPGTNGHGQLYVVHVQPWISKEMDVNEEFQVTKVGH